MSKYFNKGRVQKHYMAQCKLNCPKNIEKKSRYPLKIVQKRFFLIFAYSSYSSALLRLKLYTKIGLYSKPFKVSSVDVRHSSQLEPT